MINFHIVVILRSHIKLQSFLFLLYQIRKELKSERNHFIK
nr:MAG TPA: hypothetical protein [Caudoviricetes sp.]